MDHRTSAAALGLSAVAVVAAGLTVTVVRTDDSGVRPSAGAVSTSPTPTPTPSGSSPPRATQPQHADAGRKAPNAAPGAAGHSGGKSGTAGKAGKAGSGTLPFTGSVPLPTGTAIGMLLAIAGAWTLVQVPPTVARATPPTALDRLRRLPR